MNLKSVLNSEGAAQEEEGPKRGGGRACGIHISWDGKAVNGAVIRCMGLDEFHWILVIA